MNSIKFTLYMSITIQVIALLLGFFAQMKKVNEENRLLHDIMTMENIVQIVEFSFYISISIFVVNFIDTDIAKFRYYDWMITTPIMLITTMLYFIHNNKCKEQQRDKDKMNIWSIVKDEKESILKIVLSNLGMLVVGYLQEIGKVSLLFSTITGFGFLDYSFYQLYQYIGDGNSKKLFWFMFLIWSFYGFAAMMKNKVKNTMYNVLDVVSKNFYGIFIAYQILM